MKLKLSVTNLKKWFISIFLLAFFVFGIMVSFNSMNLSEKLANKPVFLLLVGVFLILFFGKNKEQPRGRYYILFIVLGLCSLLSSLANISLVMIGNSFCGMLVLWIVPKLKLGDIKKTYGILFVPYIIACLIAIYRYGISGFNSQGIIYVFLGILLLNFLCLKEKDSIILYLLTIFLIVMLLSLTRSRTSMLAFLIAALTTYGYLFLKKKTIKNLLLGLAIAIGLFAVQGILIDFFGEIFFNKWGNIDLTSNRISIWNMIIKRTSFFGHGTKYIIDLDAHNTFMQILDVFGIIPFSILFLAVASIFKNIYCTKNRIIFLNFFVPWFVVSMFENLDIFTSRMLPITMLFLLHIAFLSNEFNSNKGREKCGHAVPIGGK